MEHADSCTYDSRYITWLFIVVPPEVAVAEGCSVWGQRWMANTIVFLPRWVYGRLDSVWEWGYTVNIGSPLTHISKLGSRQRSL